VTLQQDLERLGHAIKDAEARLKVFGQTLDGIAKEIEDLEEVVELLTENLVFLKKKNVIALAAEFKKGTNDLNKAKAKIAKVRIDRENILRAAKEVEEYLLKTKTDYAKILKGPNNILAFRRKDAKE
jgi:chromosome segregation ATPase